MILQECKEYAASRWDGPTRDMLLFLIAELEQAHKIGAAIEKVTATRCAEIVELAFNDCKQPLESEHAHDLFMIAETIRTEFNLRINKRLTSFLPRKCLVGVVGLQKRRNILMMDKENVVESKKCTTVKELRRWLEPLTDEQALEVDVELIKENHFSKMVNDSLVIHEGYPDDWARVILMVSPNGETHAIGGDRELGDGDMPYIGLERIKKAGAV